MLLKRNMRIINRGECILLKILTYKWKSKDNSNISDKGSLQTQPEALQCVVVKTWKIWKTTYILVSEKKKLI